MGVESKATASVRSQTLNLSEYDTSITVDSVSKAIEHKYFGMTSCGSHIDPTEENFPGIYCFLLFIFQAMFFKPYVIFIIVFY